MRALLAKIALFVALLCGLNVSASAGHELSGYIATESRIFFDDPLFSGQEKDSFSFASQPEYYHEWENGSSFLFVPFLRLDSADSRRTHFDIRELNYLWLTDNWELRIGVGKVFWGTTEFLHLVDIINQTDLIENIDQEEKLGQPMVHLSVPRDWGVLDMFVLPYFRERTFPGSKGRLRSALAVDTDKPRYESSAREHNVDFALRYSHTIGDWDFGIYHFIGTGREPTLLMENNKLIPFYEQINQTGLDLQLVAGQWLWKLEALYRTGQGEAFFGGVGGFEYSLVGIAETNMDLGIIGEWAYDERGGDTTTGFQNDAMFGLRLAFNDAASTELLAGLIQDIDGAARAVSVEASRRMGSNWKLSLEARTFFEIPESDPVYGLLNDDFVLLELAYYF
ncbi:MAG: hypothetical protein ACYS3N_00085 [Planctomycetota bacterium]|jgi:hypothetical protein